MAENRTTLEIIFDEWRQHQEHLKRVLAPLTAGQLQLRAAPGQLSVGQLAQHIVAVRVFWFHGILGEGGQEIAAYALWDESEAPPRPATELVHGLDASWELMAGAWGGWSAADMAKTFPRQQVGTAAHVSRSWVVWHVLEQDLHHGGEITVTLGMHGLEGLDL